MIRQDSRLRFRHDDVVAKVMDGEAVILNLSNGLYYTLDHAGAVMWELIEQGHRIDAVGAAIAARYEVPQEVAEADALRLAGELLRAELVVESADGGGAPPRDAAAVTDARLPYVPPTLHAYTDMEDLLALDPPTPQFVDIPWKG